MPRKFSKKNILYTILLIVLLIAVGYVITHKDVIFGTGSTQPVPSEQTGPTEPTVRTAFDYTQADFADAGLRVYYLNVGQGDGILLRYKDGTDFLIDAGSTTRTPSKAKADELMFNYLKEKVFTTDDKTIEYLIATHSDSDHINMMPYVFDNYTVGHVYYNPDNHDTVAYRNAVTAYARASEITPIPQYGETYVITRAELTVTIYAPGYKRFSDVNSSSPIIVVEYRETRLVFTGDAHANTEAWFLSERAKTNGATKTDVLKVGHHGSSSSSSVAFLSALSPEFAVISVGAGNTYGHPTAQTMSRLSAIGCATYRTDRQGNIALFVNADGRYGFLTDNQNDVDNNKDNKLDFRINPTL